MFNPVNFFMYPTLWSELSVKFCVPHPMAAYDGLCRSQGVGLQRGNEFSTLKLRKLRPFPRCSTTYNDLHRSS